MFVLPVIPYPSIDPILISIGPLAVRWYGLMYLLGFVLFLTLGRLRARQAKIHLEAHPSLRIFRARVAPQIVLAGREKDRWSLTSAAVVERGLPGVACRANQRLHAATALDADSCSSGFGDERCIKRLARERGRRKRQWSLRCASRSGQANVVDRYGAKRRHIHPERVQILKRLTAQELSADLMPRCGLAFDQSDASPLPRERDGSCTACHTPTDDENFIWNRYTIQTGRSNWNLLFRIRYVGFYRVYWVFHDRCCNSVVAQVEIFGPRATVGRGAGEKGSNSLRCSIFRTGENERFVILPTLTSRSFPHKALPRS